MKAQDNHLAGTLADWGEFRLINDVILPVLKDTTVLNPLGDDCAYLPMADGSYSLAITTDAAPIPLVWHLGHKSYWVWGWYSVLINASDLAAGGARPLAFTSSVEAPASMQADDLKDFFSGMAAACKEIKIPNAGGNIRSAPRFECHGTALGTVDTNKLLTRSGCNPGDAIVAIGDCGRFISAYLKAQATGLASLPEDEQNRLLRPLPQLRAMECLNTAGVLSAASDNSDGVLGALWNIAERSECGFEVQMDDRTVPDEVKSVATKFKISPWNLMFFWGDWQVLAAVRSTEVRRFRAICEESAINYLELGWAIDSPPVLYGRNNGQRQRLNILRNENFIPTAFNADIEHQLRYMLYTPLFA